MLLTYCPFDLGHRILLTWRDELPPRRGESFGEGEACLLLWH